MYQKSWWYDLQFLMYRVWQTEISNSGSFFLFCPTNDLENHICEKMKKMCAINDNHMVYTSWDMDRNRQNFLSFWTIFCPFTIPNSPFTTLTTQKINILKKWKKHQEKFIFHFGLFFAFYTPNNPKKSKFKKNEKNTWRYHRFIHVYQKLWSRCTVPETWCVTDRQTDERTEKVTYRGKCLT